MGNAAYVVGGNGAGGWSRVYNPNGHWKYGSKPTKSGAFTLFNTTNPGGWRMGNIDADGVIWKNYNSYSKNGVLPGEICIHPGEDGQWTVLRWTAPESMTVNVKGHFGSGDINSMTYSIIHNNTTLCFDKYLVTTTEYFDFNVSVSAGDTLDFQVGDHYDYGSTPIDVTVGTEYFNTEIDAAPSKRIRGLKAKMIGGTFARRKSVKIIGGGRVNL